MNQKITEIAERVKELREILEISEEEMAQALNITVDEYRDYENGTTDMPISILYEIALKLKTDPTELMTGESPKMAQYTVVRQGEGEFFERYEGYNYYFLAVNIKDRAMDPMLVTLKKDKAKIQYMTHKGQEFNYIVKGTVSVRLGINEIVLNQGDSIYFNSLIPHSQTAVSDEAVFLTVINECSAK